jgi:hypothetical protein
MNLPPGSQTGDITSGDAAGRDIYHGLSGKELLLAIAQQQQASQRDVERQQEFYLTLVSAYERLSTDTAKKLERFRDEQDIHRAGERAAREARQRELDRKLAALAFSIAVLVAVEFWLVWSIFASAV